MLSTKAKIAVMAEAIRNRYDDRRTSALSTDYRQDLQFLIFGSSVMAALDLKDALLDPDRFQPIPVHLLDRFMSFDPAQAEILIYCGLRQAPKGTPGVKGKWLSSFRVRDSEERIYVQKRVLDILDYSSRDDAQVVFLTRRNDRPEFVWLWDMKREEADAMICPVRILMEDGNDGTDSIS